MEGLGYFLLFAIVVWFLLQIRKGYAGSGASAQSVNSGAFETKVVGESHYQPALDKICGGRCEDGVNQHASATLVLEDDNRYDKNAVRVEISNTTVGYLAREDARLYRKRLRDKGNKAPRTCRAVIRGGWDRGGDDQGYFGVRLDLDL